MLLKVAKAATRVRGVKKRKWGVKSKRGASSRGKKGQAEHDVCISLMAKLNTQLNTGIGDERWPSTSPRY